MILRQGVPVKNMASIRCRIAAPQHRAVSTYEDLFFIYIYLYIIIITCWRACYSMETAIWRVKRTPKQSIRTLFRGVPQSFYFLALPRPKTGQSAQSRLVHFTLGNTENPLTKALCVAPRRGRGASVPGKYPGCRLDTPPAKPQIPGCGPRAEQTLERLRLDEFDGSHGDPPALCGALQTLVAITLPA